jgi:O-antigen ligase
MYTSDLHEGWKNIYMKSGLVIATIGFFGCLSVIRYERGKFIFYYALILSLALLFCLISSWFRYNRTGDDAVFFYYQLLHPAKQHATYYSLFVFAGLVMVIESVKKRIFIAPPWIYYFFSILFIGFLFLLSSRLIIGISFLYIIFLITGKIIKPRISILFGLPVIVCLLALVSFTRNPLSDRFTELFNGKMNMIEKETNTRSDYFNGWQFRLLQWKLVPQILEENNSWLTGVSPGDAQHLLDKRYEQRQMYMGDPSRGEEGFKGYYTHNSYLEALLQLGLAGLFSFLLMVAALIKITWKAGRTGYSWIGIALVAVSFTESYFESQYGIITFSFLAMVLAVMPSNLLKTIPSR